MPAASVRAARNDRVVHEFAAHTKDVGMDRLGELGVMLEETLVLPEPQRPVGRRRDIQAVGFPHRGLQ